MLRCEELSRLGRVLVQHNAASQTGCAPGGAFEQWPPCTSVKREWSALFWR